MSKTLDLDQIHAETKKLADHRAYLLAEGGSDYNVANSAATFKGFPSQDHKFLMVEVAARVNVGDYVEHHSHGRKHLVESIEAHVGCQILKTAEVVGEAEVYSVVTSNGSDTLHREALNLKILAHGFNKIQILRKHAMHLQGRVLKIAGSYFKIYALVGDPADINRVWADYTPFILPAPKSFQPQKKEMPSWLKNQPLTMAPSWGQNIAADGRI